MFAPAKEYEMTGIICFAVKDNVGGRGNPAAGPNWLA